MMLFYYDIGVQLLNLFISHVMLIMQMDVKFDVIKVIDIFLFSNRRGIPGRPILNGYCGDYEWTQYARCNTKVHST